MSQFPVIPGAHTDVEAFVTDLEAGRFANMLSVALSQTAAAVVDRGKKGKVVIEFEIDNIPGTSQVRVEHYIKFTQPTERGKLIEDSGGATVLHVGKGGKLSLSQQALFTDETRQTRVPGSN